MEINQDKVIYKEILYMFLRYCDECGLEESKFDFDFIKIKKEPNLDNKFTIICKCDWAKLFGGLDGKNEFVKGFKFDAVSFLIII